MKKLAIGILIVSLLIFTAGSSFAEKSVLQRGSERNLLHVRHGIGRGVLVSGL